MTGRRLTTTTLWDTEDSLRAAMRRGSHLQAMREFETVADAGTTRVFAAQRSAVYLQRCPACGRMNRAAERHATCACGTPLDGAL